MRPAKIVMSIFLLWLSYASSASAATGAVNITNSGIQFPDNSVQTKAAVLPTCSTGDILVNNSGSWYCGTIMLVSNGVATCAQSVCSINACASGFKDCDGETNSGCETNITTTENCGVCGHVCAGYQTCVSGVCTGIPPSVCGDGNVADLEQCDDGNTANGDGCSSTCTVENTFECVGSPSVCTFTIFGGGSGWGAQLHDIGLNSGEGSLAVTLRFNPIDGISNNIWLLVDDISIGTGVTDLTTDLTGWGTLNLSNPINANIDFAYSGHRGQYGGNLATNNSARKWVSGSSAVVSGLAITQDDTNGIYSFNIPYASIGSGASSGATVRIYAFYGQNSAYGGIHSAAPVPSAAQLSLMNSSASTAGSGLTSLDTMAPGYVLK